MAFEKITESESLHQNLEQQSVEQLVSIINTEDHKVSVAVGSVLPSIQQLTKQVVEQLKMGGRLFYIGAGTSGRLGVLDASECPPTFGVSPGLVIGIIAGGDKALRKSVEFAEDDTQQAWLDLLKHKITSKDIVVGIAASGTTPYVIGALMECNKNGIATGCITCNPGSPLSQVAKYPIEVVVGPEVLTGSSRMKAGTAQKMILNMISTVSMTRLGHVKGNKMVDMQLSNSKLKQRGVAMIVDELSISTNQAEKLLKKHGSVRSVIMNYQKNG
ncbi:MAG: N-acetylmuramic acid 6-phosphate etherase [Flavobacteriaceae bacterium]|nr:N-acetylmuramic acid 6-phosphate etherase [Flavobacteriaceae bacterium]MDG2315012.1 N-acetylmuramic acid 6-phosphate etherase [Flavobacteriaceae bacterium]